MANIVTRLNPLFQRILMEMYNYGLDENSKYDREKGKIWTSRISDLVRSNNNAVESGLKILKSYELIEPANKNLEKVNDNGVEKYIQCYVIHDKYFNDIKDWFDMINGTDLADSGWWDKD